MNKVSVLVSSWMFVFAIFGGVFGFTTVGYTKTDACSCYCAVEGIGATRFPRDSNNQLTPTTCEETCKKYKSIVAVCASTPEQLPSQNMLCFTQGQCSAQKGILDEKYQPAECLPNSHYCYPDPKNALKSKLQVSIGTMTLPQDLGEYIGTLYKWFIGFSTTVAIVFMMVGGLQWTISATGFDQRKKAQTLIFNGMIGLVLLLSAHLILYTVNPALISLQVPDFPMIKRVEISSEKSCGYLVGRYGTQLYLRDQGAPTDSPYSIGQPAPQGGTKYELKDPSNAPKCGSVAEIVKDWEGNEVPDGQTCIYDYCEDPNAACFGVGANAKCAKCENVYPGSYPAPSSEVCARLTDHQYTADEVQEARYCEYTNDPVLLLSTGLVASAVTGLCASVKFPCGKINTCEDYEINFLNNDVLVSVALTGRYLQFHQEILEKICSEDICEVGEKTGKTCVFEEDIAYNDCVSK